jgi:hypothetical protein
MVMNKSEKAKLNIKIYAGFDLSELSKPMVNKTSVLPIVPQIKPTESSII